MSRISSARAMRSRWTTSIREGFNEPRARSINFFEDPATHLPRDPRIFGRPDPQFINITRYETTASSDYDGWQFGLQARSIGPQWMKSQVSGSYTLSWTYSDHESNRFDGVTNPFNLADEWSFSAGDQRHRAVINNVSQLPWDFQVAADLLRRVAATRSIPGRTSIRSAWRRLAAGSMPPAAPSAATASARPKNDYKLDLRLTKTVVMRQSAAPGNHRGVQHPEHQEPHQLQRHRYGSSTYLQPASSTDIFYQPRQLQFGFRVTY